MFLCKSPFTKIFVLLFSLTLAACGGGGGGGESIPQITLTGIVMDSNGTPVPGASVTINSEPVTVVTDSAGRFSADVPAGAHTITVTSGGTVIHTSSFNTDAGPNLGSLSPTTPFVLPPDADSDGVPDSADTCANTPAGETPNAAGCSPSQIDTDGDGVFDNLDTCPSTPSGELPNAAGCSTSQIDTDGDGVFDNADTCPNTPAGETPNAVGCSTSQIDTDGDGVFDNLDTCAGTPAGETPNAVGCSTSQTDLDGDGVFDNADLCHTTPPSEQANADGCSPSQLDTDNDGLNDKLDACPNTLLGATVDANGCTASQLTGKVSSGDFHTCAVTTAGGVKCWGNNSFGQLGDGTKTSSQTATGVIGLTSGVTAVAVGANHSCALTTAGGVKCWGRNHAGQLGSALNTIVPLDVPELTGVVALVAGNNHTCALAAAGGVKCWGLNSFGQLGNGSTTNADIPVSVTNLSSGVAALAGGSNHTCALTTVGGAKCWGLNSDGQLGNNSLVDAHTPVTAMSNAVAIAAGGGHSCAVRTDGTARCWGSNARGQLGDGTLVAKSLPIPVVTLTGVTAIAAGTDHTCALTLLNGMKCWGRNSLGQLGNGSTNSARTAPVSVTGLLSGVAEVSASRSYTCVRTRLGGIKCWGANFDAQLGDGTTTSASTPVDAIGLTNSVADIAAGRFHSCVVTATGGVKCGGNNDQGQLGNGTTSNLASLAVDVVGLTSSVAAVTTGANHSCALTTLGGVKCWGDGTNLSPVDVFGATSGVVALSASAFNTCAVTVNGRVKCWSSSLGAAVEKTGFSGDVAKVATGDSHSCAVTTAGAAQCWGNNDSGQLGNNTTTNFSAPVNVFGLTSGVVDVAVGEFHSCAVTTAGAVKCWGENAGKLGNGSTTGSLVPVNVTGLNSGMAAVTANRFHTCALSTIGGITCWGSNTQGQLGDGTGASTLVPVDVTGHTSGVAKVTAGESHTCALSTTGGATCWGTNTQGQLGDGLLGNAFAPVGVLDLPASATALTAGGSHSCVVTKAGEARCWGMNNNGQLGNGLTVIDATPTPMKVIGLSERMTAIAGGFRHSCALTAAGGVKCWGQNRRGQLGNGTSADSSTPVNVTGLTSGVIAVATGAQHSCALTTAGGVKCWGDNFVGQLGNGSATDSSTPVNVTGLTSGSIAIATGAQHSCALSIIGSVKCWGFNLGGQLGNGLATSTATPVGVIGLTSGVTDLAAGKNHTCALTTTGGVMCWGINASGQLGDDSTTFSFIPVDVLGIKFEPRRFLF